MPTEQNTSRISLHRYNEAEYSFEKSFSVQRLSELDINSKIHWINVVGLDEKMLKKMSKIFNIHPLVIEDIQNTHQRAKTEDYGDVQYVVLKLYAIIDDKIEDQQMSFILSNNLLITFRERQFGIFQPVVDKLQNPASPLRKRGEDFLLYTLLDVIIDNYYHVLEWLNNSIEKLEVEIVRNPKDSHLLDLQRFKERILKIRRHILPVRDLLNNLSRHEVSYFEAENKYYLRDLQDHMVRNVEEVDFQREQISSLMEIYYSLQTRKMNNVMKTLTGVSFVILPLTFLASLYGMNFKHIPRADDPNGFYEMLGIMAFIAFILTIFAFRRKWLSPQDFEK